MTRLLAACCAVVLGGCVTLPGRDFPREPPAPPVRAANPALAAPLAQLASTHPGDSGFRLFSVGVDGLLLRLELIAQAQRSLDLQYYVFRGDESGRLITDALEQAAARGVRVRILIDDAERTAADEQLFALAPRVNVSIRVFNPWRYRGYNALLRGVEFLFSGGRLDHRMHNKLFVADGVIALLGGRNIGDPYFQVDPESQLADDDVLVAGPVVADLAATFEQYWESESAVPALALRRARAAALEPEGRRTVPEKAASAGLRYEEKLAAGEPLASVLAGQAPLAWARAEVACDSPDRKRRAGGAHVGGLMFAPVAAAIRQTRSELTLVTPYLVPSADETALLRERRAQQVRVRILTNSLEATDHPLAQSGYVRHRVALLESGVELFEVRARPQSSRGSGQSARLSRFGHFGLHAKLLAFDRSGVFVGSMNFDQRSRWLNTENGLLIHSPELAEQTVRRFTAMTQPLNAYAVRLGEPRPGARSVLTWSTLEADRPVTLHKEPARSAWQRLQVHVLALLPLEREL